MVITLNVNNEAALRMRLSIDPAVSTQDWLTAWEANLEAEGGQQLIAVALQAMQAGSIPIPQTPFTPDTAQSAIALIDPSITPVSQAVPLN